MFNKQEINFEIKISCITSLLFFNILVDIFDLKVKSLTTSKNDVF